MSLLALQRDFRDWLTTESPDAAIRLGDGPGLAVYLNTYRAQLMACLAETFETVRAWLGDAAFDAAAATHVDRVPPSRWTLDAYAEHFPETLDTLYPSDPEVGEMARLDRALSNAFVGPDPEPLDPASLAEVDWDRAMLRLVPTFVLLPASSNAGAIWSAIARGDVPPAAERLGEAAYIAVWREGFTPAFRTLEAPEAEALDAVVAGRTFGAICASLVESLGEDRGSAMAGAYLGRWLSDHLVMAVDVVPSLPIPSPHAENG
jgi:hypothetical protein